MKFSGRLFLSFLFFIIAFQLFSQVTMPDTSVTMPVKPGRTSYGLQAGTMFGISDGYGSLRPPGYLSYE